MMRHSRKELKIIFSPRNCLKGVEITSRSINLSEIEVIRHHVEGIKKGWIGIAPSSSSIKNVAKRVSVCADELIPFNSLETLTGEGIRFDVIKLLRFLLKSHSILDHAKSRRIGLSISSDGEKMTNNILQVVAGVKVNDVAATCPLTKDRSSSQTQNICWPFFCHGLGKHSNAWQKCQTTLLVVWRGFERRWTWQLQKSIRHQTFAHEQH